MRRRSVGSLMMVLVGLTASPYRGVCSLIAQEAEPRSVSDNVLISPHLPPLAVRVARDFAYLGAHPIQIRDVAGGERHVFADVRNGEVKRLVVMQFEGFHEGIEDEYRYDLSRSPVVAGFPFRSNGFAFDMVGARRQNPRGEAATTDAFLRSLDLEPPRHWMMWRSLTVADASRRHELIIFYVEDAGSRGLSTADLYDSGDDTEVWRRIQDELEVTAHQTIELAPLDRDGQPDVGEWSRIPRSRGR